MDLRLTPKQGRAFRSRATEILYGGAAGGGKSHLMRVAAISWCYAIPGLQAYLFRRTYGELEQSHMDGPTGFPALLAPWIEKGFARVNLSRGRSFIGFPSLGSKIHLCHCQRENDKYLYQSAEIHALLIDELTHFTESIYRFLRGRCRVAGLEIPGRFRGQFPRILNGSNPGGIGHNWVKKAFVSPAPEGVIWDTPPKEGGFRRQFIRALLEDNPHLAAGYENALEGLGPAWLVSAMSSGNWNIVAGGMFDDVWDEAKHVLKPFPIPESWPLTRSLDWGSAKPFSVGWWAEADGTEAPNGVVYPRGTLIRISEWYGCEADEPNTGLRMLAQQVAEGIKEKESNGLAPGRKVAPGPADRSIWAEENGTSIYRSFKDAGVDWTRAEQSPGSRKARWEAFRDRLKAATERPMERPGLFVFDNCRDFIELIPAMPRSKRDPDDLDTDAEDHIADEAGYRVAAAGIVKPESAAANLPGW